LEFIEDISKRQKKIIVYEFISISQKELVDTYFESVCGKSLVYIDDSRSKESFRQSVNSVQLNISLPKEISKIQVHSVYFYGDYFILVFECDLNLKEYNEQLTGDFVDTFNQRYRAYEEMQKKIEKLLPNEFHGLFFNNEMKFYGSNCILPSLYVYDLQAYRQFVFEDPKGGILNTPQFYQTLRGKAKTFLHKFDEYDEYDDESDDEPKFNKMHFLGIRPKNLFAVLSDRLIVSQSGVYFQDILKPIPCNFIILDFEKQQTLNFIYEFIAKYYLMIILEKLLIKLTEINIPRISDIEENSLDIYKRKLLMEKAYLNDINNDIFLYLRIFNYFNKDNFKFTEEETWVSYVVGGRHEKSISDYFKDYLTDIKKEIESKQQYLEKIFVEIIDYINAELEFNKDKPKINVLYKEISDELVLQIKKWDKIISQDKIESWLSNFENKNDRITALKLLDKLTYIQNKDMKIFVKSAYNKLLANINKDNLNDCNISSIGEITSGSTHFLKPFQEENRISPRLFSTIEELNLINQDKKLKETLILIDDFVGSGNTFIKWHTNNLDLLNNFKIIFYVCFTAFQKGIDRIQEETKVQVICAYLIEESQQVIDGTLFNDEEITIIKDLIEKYSSRIGVDYLYGYDNCQLLLSFEDNIPNNSLGLLWWPKNWIPLLERK